MSRIIRCKTCKKVIMRIKTHAGKDKIISAIRNHYKKYHYHKFRGFYKTGVRPHGFRKNISLEEFEQMSKESKEHPQLSQQESLQIARQHKELGVD